MRCETASIIIPCFNYGRFLGEAIESALDQTRPADEIIVIDDGSTDCTPEVIDRYARHATIRPIRQTNQGAIASFNRGIRASRGAFFVLLSADDRLDPRFLARTVPILADRPDAGFAYTAYRVFGARHRVRPALPFSPARLARRPYFTASALIRRRAFDALGGFSDELAIGYEDWDLFLGLVERGWRGVPVPEVLFHYRQHRTASRNTMSTRTWLGLLALLYRRHRDLHRAPLPAFLLGALAEQYWLTLRAAPRAALRRLGTPPAPGDPRVCFLSVDGGIDALTGRAIEHAAASPVVPDPAGACATACGGAAGPGLSATLRWARRARDLRAPVYHARGAAALAPAALAATTNRALLVYEAPGHERAPATWTGHALAWLAARRIDALVVGDGEAASRWDRRFGLQPTLCYGADRPEDRRVDARRLAQLYTDLLSLSRPATPEPEGR